MSDAQLKTERQIVEIKSRPDESNRADIVAMLLRALEWKRAQDGDHQQE